MADSNDDGLKKPMRHTMVRTEQRALMEEDRAGTWIKFAHYEEVLERLTSARAACVLAQKRAEDWEKDSDFAREGWRNWEQHARNAWAAQEAASKREDIALAKLATATEALKAISLQPACKKFPPCSDDRGRCDKCLADKALAMIQAPANGATPPPAPPRDGEGGTATATATATAVEEALHAAVRFGMFAKSTKEHNTPEFMADFWARFEAFEKLVDALANGGAPGQTDISDIRNSQGDGGA